MTTGTLGWGDVLLRLGLAAVAGTSIGINRGQRGRAAGMRTMLLVCAGAALAMLVAQWMFIRDGGAGSGGDSNPSRWAQGILAGMGFLGAGAVLRKGNMIRGVTTAASLWYVTILGLCFGSGYWSLGLAAFALALVALLVLPYAEFHIHSDRFSTVTVVTRSDGMTERELCNRLASRGLEVERFAIHFLVAERLKTIRCDVKYHVGLQLEVPLEVIADLSRQPGIVEVRWK